MVFPDNFESLFKKVSKIDQKFHVKMDSQSRRFKLAETSPTFFLLRSVPFFYRKSPGARTSLKLWLMWGRSRNWCSRFVDVVSTVAQWYIFYPKSAHRVYPGNCSKKNARTLNFLALYFWPNLEIRLEHKMINTFVKRDDLQILCYEMSNFDTKWKTYPMIHYWSWCCNQTARSPKFTKVVFILSSRQIF